jgi:molybdate-binding protein/DNA-binding XRE family transcriptional regulator
MEQALTNRIKTCRSAKGWSQEELADRAGISRAGVSAIETGRLVPSTSAALALAAALECRVEDIFQFGTPAGHEAVWAWPPPREVCRYWRAAVSGRELLYPVETASLGVSAHDGLSSAGTLRERTHAAPSLTLVAASCDPAIGLLADHFARRGFRLIAFQRSSRQSLNLLGSGLVHAAGVHLAKAGQGKVNASAAKKHLTGDFLLLRVARWQEGLAAAPGRRVTSVGAAARSSGRWIGREEGSAARELLDELLAGRRPPRRVAYGHRGVAEAIRSGWADLGICVRLAADEAGLDFISVRREDYDLCIPAELEGDPRIRALADTLRSPEFRAALGDLPGYDTSDTGEIEHISRVG